MPLKTVLFLDKYKKLKVAHPGGKYQDYNN